MVNKNTFSRAVSGRQGLLAKVHIAGKDLTDKLPGFDYRQMLFDRYGVESSKELRIGQLEDLVRHMETLGWVAKPTKRQKAMAKDAARPKEKHERREGLMGKIEALLAEKGRAEGTYVPWSYAASILKKQGGPDRFEWATDAQLRGVMIALTRDAERKGRRTE